MAKQCNQKEKANFYYEKWLVSMMFAYQGEPRDPTARVSRYINAG